MAAALAVTALLTWQVAGHGPLWRWETRADAGVLRAAAGHPGVRPVAQVFADFGDLAVALPLLAAVLAYAGVRRREWRTAAVSAALMAVTGIVVSAYKAAVGRPAPGSAVLGAHAGYFPSGHAAAWTMASGLAVLALWPLCGRPAARRLLVCAAVPLDLAVGAALVWRGYHWPFDVAASWCLCWVLLVVARRVTRWWGSRG